jgi:hypothetical protein
VTTFAVHFDLKLCESSQQTYTFNQNLCAFAIDFRSPVATISASDLIFCLLCEFKLSL